MVAIAAGREERSGWIRACVFASCCYFAAFFVSVIARVFSGVPRGVFQELIRTRRIEKSSGEERTCARADSCWCKFVWEVC